MAKLTDMPREIFERILLHVGSSTTRKTACRTYAAMCRVSRAFTRVSQEVLYHDVYLEHHPVRSTADDFRRSLKTQSGLAPVIRSLTLVENYVGAPRWQSSAPKLGPVLSKCVSLEAVRYEPALLSLLAAGEYVKLWKAIPNLRDFTLVMLDLKHLGLAPTSDVAYLTIEVTPRTLVSMPWFASPLPNVPKGPFSRVSLVGMEIPYSQQEKLHLLCKRIFDASLQVPVALEIRECRFDAQGLGWLLHKLAPSISSLVITATEVLSVDVYTWHQHRDVLIERRCSEEQVLALGAVQSMRARGIPVSVTSIVGPDDGSVAEAVVEL